MSRLRHLLLTPPVAVVVVAAVAAIALAGAPPASAGLFAGDPIVGPSANVQRLADVDLARDGTGALVFLAEEDAATRPFVAAFAQGAFAGAQRVDGAIPAGVDAAAVAAGNGGRIAVVFSAGGTVYAALRPSGGQPFSGPQAIGTGALPAVAMSPTGTAYASFTGDGDVRVARLDRRTNAWTPLSGAFDVEAGREAGTGSRRSRVAVSADGVGIVVWGELAADGRSRVYARKVFGTAPSTRPQDLTAADVDGRPAGDADLPDVDAEDDSSFAWVTFRQAVLDATGAVRLRTVARRQRGTEFDPPVAVDGMGVPADEDTAAPRIDLNGRGEGIAALAGATTNQAIGALLRDDAFARGQRYGSGGVAPAASAAAVADNGDGVLTWVQAPGAEPASVRVLPFDDGAAQPEALLSRPELGPVDPALGVEVAIDRAGSALVAWVQTSPSLPGARSIVAGYLDRPPRAFNGFTATRWRAQARPTLSWGEAVDLWGPVTYRVLLDGVQVAEVSGRTSWRPVQVLADGEHRWQVQAVDRRGQVTAARSRIVRVDVTPPQLLVRVSGRRAAGKPLKVAVRARDVSNPRGASGLARVRIDWGDGTTTTTSAFSGTWTHRYPRGTFRLRVSATDRAGAATVQRRSLRIARR